MPGNARSDDLEVIRRESQGEETPSGNLLKLMGGGRVVYT